MPLLKPVRYKGAKGGRGSGKSHFFAESIVEAMVCDKDLPVVCIREIQKSLKFSAKRLIEEKIRTLGVSGLFDITQTEIRRVGGSGICIFQGMQDHTAESIKSLEGFKIAWVEEAQSLSARSMKLLRPTIRAENSELWFSWNPDQPDDPVDEFFSQDREDAICVHVNYTDNPFLPETLRLEAESDRARYPEDFDHIWLGGYNTRSELRVFKHWRVDEIDPPAGASFYYGADWGFSNDPTVLLRAWIDEERREIYVDQQIDEIGLQIDHTPAFFKSLPQSDKHIIRADSARPEMIAYMNRRGFHCESAIKGKDSVEHGVEWLRSYDIVVHPRCALLQKELRLYSYKENRAGDILPVLEDANNHCIDALRYALEPLIRTTGIGGVTSI